MTQDEENRFFAGCAWAVPFSLALWGAAYALWSVWG